VKVPTGSSHGHASGGHASGGHDDHGHDHGPRDLSAREIITLTPLAVGCLVLGLFPNLIMTTLDAPVTKITAAAAEQARKGTVTLVDEAPERIEANPGMRIIPIERSENTKSVRADSAGWTRDAERSASRATNHAGGNEASSLEATR
jgi:hypothetical protein